MKLREKPTFYIYDVDKLANNISLKQIDISEWKLVLVAK